LLPAAAAEEMISAAAAELADIQKAQAFLLQVAQIMQ
jgi:hypothetical protein